MIILSDFVSLFFLLTSFHFYLFFDYPLLNAIVCCFFFFFFLSILQHVHTRWPEEQSLQITDRCTRSRINSAIFVSSEGRGFDSIEFLQRHGSQSVLCRKARSAENITDEDRKVMKCVNNEN